MPFGAIAADSGEPIRRDFAGVTCVGTDLFISVVPFAMSKRRPIEILAI